MKVSILVPAYREGKVLPTLLKHLIKEVKYHNYEIIVGIDGDEDNSETIVKQYGIDYFMFKQRKGVTYVMNELIRRATGDICIKFDADMRFGNPKHALNNIVKYFNDAKVGAIYYAGEQDFCQGYTNIVSLKPYLTIVK